MWCGRQADLDYLGYGLMLQLPDCWTLLTCGMGMLGRAPGHVTGVYPFSNSLPSELLKQSQWRLARA